MATKKTTTTTRPRARSMRDAALSLRATANKKSAAGATRAESLVALILRRKQRITEDFFEIGEALHELARRKLYLSLGYDSFDALVEGRGLVGSTQARKLIAVVDAYTRDQALALGLEKSFAVLTYAAATPAHEMPQLLVALGIEGRPLTALSAKEIVRRAKKVRERAGKSKPVSDAEKHARAAAASWQATLRKSGLRDAVASVRHVEGQVLLEVRVPLEQFEQFGRATGHAKK
ncbi:MAG: hypothetical protein WCJ30_03735 [Deltaproteobacteria bacterium]